MEKKEITILDLVKIAVNWIWVLLLGAVICAAVAFVYSTEMVTPMYSSSSKYVIQTKGQADNSNVADNQKGVQFAQQVVGTYIDIVDTKNFAEKVAFYMNGNTTPREYSSSSFRASIDDCIKHGLIADGIQYKEDGNLARIIDMLADSGVISEKYKDAPVSEVVENFLMNPDAAKNYTDVYKLNRLREQFEENPEWLPIYISAEEIGYIGDSDEKIEKLKKLGLADGKVFGGNKEYTRDSVNSMLSFSSAEESTTFSISVTSANPDEAYAVARVCEIIIGDYVENVYPGAGVISLIDSAVRGKNPINNNTAILTIIGFIAGFVLTFVIVYVIELADNRIKNQEELAEKTGLSVVGIIPDTQFEKKSTSGIYGKRTQ